MPMPKNAYEINSVKSEDFIENNMFLEEMLNEFQTLINEDSPEELKNALNELQKLHQMSEEYSALGRELTREEIDAYHDKARISVSHAFEEAERNAYQHQYGENSEKLYEMLHNAGQLIDSNIGAVPDLTEEFDYQASKEIVGDMFELYHRTSPNLKEATEVYFGQKYASQESRSAKNSYTLGRTGGISTVMMMLAVQGHSIDEIMDPEQLKEEKRKLFDEVAQHMQGGSKEDQEWLAKNLCDGLDAANKLVDKAVMEIDFNKENVQNSKRFCQLMHFSGCAFDAWQETKHCEQEFHDYAFKDGGKDAVSVNDVRNMYDADLGLSLRLAYNYNALYHGTLGLKDKEGNISSSAVSRSMGYLKNIEYFTDLVNKNKVEKKDTPHSEWYGVHENAKLKMYEGANNTKFSTIKYRVRGNTPEEELSFIKVSLDKNTIKNIKTEYVEGEDGIPMMNVSNMPTAMQLDAEIDINIAKTRSKKLAAVIKQTTKATKAVWHSSSEFDKAEAAIKAVQKEYEKLEQLPDEAKAVERRKIIDAIQEKSREAEYRINKYFQRKDKQAKKGEVFDEKTQNRIDIMKIAMEEIQACKDDADKKSVAFETPGVKSIAAANAAAALRKLESYADPTGERKFTSKERGEARMCLSIVLAADKVRSKKNADQVYAGDTPEKKFSKAATDQLYDKSFGLTTGNLDSKQVSRYLRNRKDLKKALDYNRSMAELTTVKTPEVKRDPISVLKKGGMKK